MSKSHHFASRQEAKLTWWQNSDMGASLLRAVMIRSLVYGPVPDVSVLLCTPMTTTDLVAESTELQISV